MKGLEILHQERRGQANTMVAFFEFCLKFIAVLAFCL
jgi:hypothetical protein